jgi:drug/metabolite transporter (DMT)-like permease
MGLVRHYGPRGGRLHGSHGAGIMGAPRTGRGGRMDEQAVQPQGARQRLAVAALVAGAIGIAMAAIFVRLREEGFGLAATAFWRLALAWPFFLALHLHGASRRDAAAHRLRTRDRLLLLIPGVFFAADLAVWHWSINLTTVANATLFANCAPIMVSIVAWLWLKERLTPVFPLGLLLALCGVVLVVRSSAGGEEHASVTGDLLGLLTAVFYASYQLSVKKARGRFSTSAIMAYAIPAACLVLLIVSLACGEVIIPRTADGWLVLMGLAVVCQILGQGLIAFALAHLPASFSSVSLLVQPIAAAVFAWLLLSESLGVLQAWGGALVLGGIVLARMGSRER